MPPNVARLPLSSFILLPFSENIYLAGFTSNIKDTPFRPHISCFTPFFVVGTSSLLLALANILTRPRARGTMSGEY